MAKGDDTIARKRNKANRKKLGKQGSSNVSARVASIIAAKKRRKSGKRRICQVILPYEFSISDIMDVVEVWVGSCISFGFLKLPLYQLISSAALVSGLLCMVSVVKDLYCA